MVEPLAQRNALEELEIDLLLEGLYQRFGEDFRGFERGALSGKLRGLMQARGLRTVSALQDQVLHHDGARDALLRALNVRHAKLFENAGQMLVLREFVGPLLRSYADPRVWLAESTCAEDIFSLAILLVEEGLGDRTTIFATAAHERLLQEARDGGFPAERFAEYEENYRKSGGQRSLAEYCSKIDGQYVFASALKSNVTWAQYNLTTDTSFNEFQLILCRRTLSEFGFGLRRRALGLFSESLVPFGVLGIEGTHEMESAPFALNYKTLSKEHALYRRTG